MTQLIVRAGVGLLVIVAFVFAGRRALRAFALWQDRRAEARRTRDEILLTEAARLPPEGERRQITDQRVGDPFHVRNIPF